MNLSADPKRIYSCTFENCLQQCKSRNDLSIHIRLNHTHEKPFTCDVCQMGFVSLPKKESHIETNHPEVTPLKCSMCPRGFFREYRLNAHKRFHTGERLLN